MGEARGRWGAIVAAAVLAATLVGVGALGPPAAAGAGPTTIRVTTTDDVTDAEDGLTSLREAFAQVSAGAGSHRILLAIGATYVLDDCNPLGTLVRNQNSVGSPTLTIEGRGSTIEQTCPSSRVMEDSGPTLVLRDLTVTGGANDISFGGGVLAHDLLLYDSAIVGNEAASNGGGIFSYGRVTAHRSLISDNTAVSGFGGGVTANEGVDLVRSTVAGNDASSAGGGAFTSFPANVISSTITGNSADEGAALYVGQLVLERSTVYRDDPGENGAAVRVTSEGPSTSMQASIVSALDESDCSLAGDPDPGNSSYSRDASCGLGAGDVEAVGPPALAALADNGGPTPTLLPVAGAGATDVRDAIAPGALCSASTADQRHVERPQGAGCEIGAVEVPNPFGDVPAASPFFMEVAWMDETGLSTGYADGGFHPADGVSRQAMAAFLYRFEGEPAGPFPDPGFPDVPDDAPFFDEISWLADSGITGGYADGTFKPANTVSRQAMAAFVYRSQGEPPFIAPAEATFPDVPVDHPFFAEIEWMADVGVSSGYSDGTWKPSANVSRQAMARFLFVTDDRLAG